MTPPGITKRLINNTTKLVSDPTEATICYRIGAKCLTSGALHVRPQMYARIPVVTATLRHSADRVVNLDEKNAKQKETIHAKAKEYMQRAEKLKQYLADKDDGNRKKPSAMGTNGSVSGGGGKGKSVKAHVPSHPERP